MWWLEIRPAMRAKMVTITLGSLSKARGPRSRSDMRLDSKEKHAQRSNRVSRALASGLAKRILPGRSFVIQNMTTKLEDTKRKLVPDLEG